MTLRENDFGFNLSVIMLWEYWQYFTTPCEKYVKAMGYLEEMISIKSRADRLKEAWEPHLRKTKEAILEGAQKCSQRRKALVCGSGWLLDVPWQELTALFEQVVLLDIIHPKAIRKLGCDRMDLIEADLSGVATSIYANPCRLPKLWEHGKRGVGQTAHNEVCSWQGLELITESIDFVCSVNLLSQLPILPVEYLRKHADFHEEELDELKRSIQKAHLYWMRSFPCGVLITDLESIRLNREGETLEQTALASLPADMSVKASWEWNLAPLGEDHPDERTMRRVVACSW